MPNTMSNVVSSLVGAGGGVTSYLVDKEDAKKVVANPALSTWKLPGTWVHYGVPIASTILSLMNVVKGEWQTRLLTLGYELAGRKGSEQVDAAMATPATQSRAAREQAEAQRRMAEAQRQAALGGGGGKPAGQYIVGGEYEILS